jgi:hypothetical protein
MLRCFRPTHTTQCLSWTATGHRFRAKASGSSSSGFRKLRNGLLVLAVACPVAACGGSDQAGKVASALTNGGGALNFDQLKGAHSASCKQSGSEHSQPVFACTWLASDGTQQQGEWVLDSGNLARVSEGGDTGSPPSDASAATVEVNKVVQERGASGNEACVKRSSAVIQGNTVGLGQNNFVCLLLDSSGAPLQANGSPVAENWNWNGDGTVAKELLDFTSGDIAAALSALNTSGNTGNTGAGNTGSGNTGAGNTGAGNTGAGNTGAGNTGAGNTGAGNTGAGNTGAGTSSPPGPGKTANGWRPCPHPSSQNYYSVTASSPGCQFGASAKTQVEGVMSTDGAGTFSTPGKVMVSGRYPLLTCVAIFNGEGVECSDGKHPWVAIYLDSGLAP